MNFVFRDYDELMHCLVFVAIVYANIHDYSSKHCYYTWYYEVPCFQQLFCTLVGSLSAKLSNILQCCLPSLQVMNIHDCSIYSNTNDNIKFDELCQAVVVIF